MIRSILAVVDNGDLAAAFLQSAARFAFAKGAVLEVAVLTPAVTASPALSPLGGIYIPDVVIMSDDGANLADVRQALEGAACEYEVYGFHDDVAWLAGDVRRSRQIADLVVTASRESWHTPALQRRVVETLIRSSGMPLLIMPKGADFTPVRRAVLGWKPSPEATRALRSLVAIAEPGAAVDIVTVTAKSDDCGRGEDSHGEVERHLARHGFPASSHWIADDDRIAADSLTRHAAQAGADLLAIGGFAHSRIREIVLGSVTRDLVGRTEVPTLIVG